MTATELSPSEIQHRLQQLDPYDFEQLVADVWEAEGYNTTVRQKSGDRGIDVEAVKEQPFRQKVLIQAKRYSDSNKIGSKEVREYATLYDQVNDVDTVVIVTTGDFTKQGKSLARDLNVKAVDGESLARMIVQNESEDILSKYNLLTGSISPTTTSNNEQSQGGTGAIDFGDEIIESLENVDETQVESNRGDDIDDGKINLVGNIWLIGTILLFGHAIMNIYPQDASIGFIILFVLWVFGGAIALMISDMIYYGGQNFDLNTSDK